MKEIKLRKGEIVLVDDDDYDKLISFNWYAIYEPNGAFYAVRGFRNNGRKYIISMHRQILGLTHGDGKIVDHIDVNSANNCKSNLRICTNAENSRNKRKKKNCSSSYYGVYLYKQKYFNKTKNEWAATPPKWKAQICFNDKKIHIGHYKTEKEAALAYNKMAKELFGEFAPLNTILTY